MYLFVFILWNKLGVWTMTLFDQCYNLFINSVQMANKASFSEFKWQVFI